MKGVGIIFLIFIFLVSFAFSQKAKKILPPKDLVSYFKVNTADLTVYAADVTGDKKPEYFVNNKKFCGAGRCSTTLYRRQGSNFIVLFEIDTWLEVDEGWTEGYRNIVVIDWFADVYTLSHYRWNGQEYVEFKCTEKQRFGKNKGKVKQVPCEEQ